MQKKVIFSSFSSFSRGSDSKITLFYSYFCSIILNMASPPAMYALMMSRWGHGTSDRYIQHMEQSLSQDFTPIRWA